VDAKSNHRAPLARYREGAADEAPENMWWPGPIRPKPIWCSLLHNTANFRLDARRDMPMMALRVVFDRTPHEALKSFLSVS
jgi:hypothetical protein